MNHKTVLCVSECICKSMCGASRGRRGYILLSAPDVMLCNPNLGFSPLPPPPTHLPWFPLAAEAQPSHCESETGLKRNERNLESRMRE